MLSLDCIRQEVVEEYFEIMVKDGDTSILFTFMGENPKRRVSLNRIEIKLGTIYADVTEKVDIDHKQSIVLKNYNNIPAQFSWEEKVESERIVARFEPKRGLIPPKSEIRVYFQTTLYYGGVVEELLICNVEDLEIPLGFEIKADQFGLNVSHQDAQDQAANMTMKTKSAMKDSMNQTNTSLKSVVTTYSDIQNTTGVASNFIGMFGFILMNKLQKELEGKQLMSLTFANCKINKPTSQKFILKNLSGIKANFKFESISFEPVSHVAPQEKSEIQKALEEQTRLGALNEYAKAALTKVEAQALKNNGKQIRFAETTKSSNTIGTIMRNLFTQQVENSRSAQRLSCLMSTSIPRSLAQYRATTSLKLKRLRRNRATISETKKVQLLSSILILVSCLLTQRSPSLSLSTTTCGKFDDKLLSNIKGLPAFEFPISIGISGSPIIIPVNQVGLNYKSTPPSLPMPCLVTNSQSILKTFKLKNIGNRAIQLDWKIYDQKDQQIKTCLRQKQTHIFQTVMGPRDIQTFTAIFQSNKGVGQFQSILMDTPELSKDELAEEGDEFLKKGALGVIFLGLLVRQQSQFLQRSQVMMARTI